jgi:heme-degrading monooxygenase HmoA
MPIRGNSFFRGLESARKRQPDKIDDAASGFEQNDIPMFKGLDGFNGFTLIADRSSGKVIGVSFWESEEAMQASEDAVKDEV